MSRCFADGWFHFAERTGLLAAVVAGVSLAAAGPSALSSDTLDLPPTATRGARVAQPAEGVHHLDGESLRRFATLEDALASLPGFRVRRAGGLGGYSELSFRGARASAVEVYVDGVRLNQDGDGAPDLSRWPALWFSSLTARTGFDAEGASPGALARIDLSTRSAHRVEAHARGGSFGTVEGAAQVTHAPAPGWSVTAAVQGQAARNDYPVNSDNGTLYNTADDRAWRMDNNAYASRGARAALRHARAEGAQEFSVLWLDARKEYPGRFPSTAQAYTTRTDWLAAWRLTRTLDAWPLGHGASWGASAQARRLEESYRDPNQTLGAFSFEQARVATSGELAATAEASLRRGLSAHLGAHLRAEDVSPTRKAFTQQMESPAAQRAEAGAALRATARSLPFLPAAVTVTAEAHPAWIRFEADAVRSFPSEPLGAPVSETFAPLALRAAAEWPTPHKRWGTWGLVLRREPRAPSSGELLGDNNGIQHNPTLKAEEARSLSLLHAVSFGASRGSGVSGAPGRAWSARAQTTVYMNRYADPIRLAARGTSPFLRYENAEDYQALGAEWSVNAAVPFFEGAFSVSAQDAAIREGIYEGNRPAWLSEVEAHAEAFIVPLEGVRVGSLADFRGPYYPGDANIPVSRRGAEWELGAHAGFARGPARLAFDARNLLDRRYRDFAYSPRSGRAWSLTFSFVL